MKLVSELTTKYVDVTFDGTNKQMVTGVYQYDHGISLRVHGIPTDVVWQMHFGFQGSTYTVPSIAVPSEGAVIGAIPDGVLMQHREVICYLYYEAEDTGVTVYEICIPLIPRTQPPVGTYTPEQIESFE